MREEEFDALMPSRPFGSEDARRMDLRLRRSASLAAALWGKTPDELRRQLLSRSPVIPSGFDADDFRGLLKVTERLLAGMSNPRNDLMSRMAFAGQTIVVGTERYTEWEARCEIIRRAISYLENR